MSVSPTTTMGGGTTSLAMLVQQRELQNNRKLEALVTKNDELAEAYKHAEQEREVLLARLGHLDGRISETGNGLLTLRKDTEGRLGEHTSRMAYLEQGVEERFRILEDAAEAPPKPLFDPSMIRTHIEDALRSFTAGLRKEMQEKDERLAVLTDTVHALTARIGGTALQSELDGLALAARHLREENTEKEASLVAKMESQSVSVSKQIERLEAEVDGARRHITLLADRIGGADLQTELQTLHSMQGEQEATLIQQLESQSHSVTRQLEKLGEKLSQADGKAEKSLDTKCRSMEDRMQKLQTTSETRLETLHTALSKLASKIESTEKRSLQNEDRVKHLNAHRTALSESLGTAEGRLNTLEASSEEFQEKVIEAASSAAGQVKRVETLEAKVGSHEAKIVSLDAELKSAVSSIQGQADRQQDHDERAATLRDHVEELMQQLANDVRVVEEKRRQKDREYAESASKLAELDRQDLEDIRRDIELLKDSSPVVDESRVVALVQELDRGKDVLESIVKMHEIKLDERSDVIEKRLAELEKRILATPPPQQKHQERLLQRQLPQEQQQQPQLLQQQEQLLPRPITPRLFASAAPPLSVPSVGPPATAANTMVTTMSSTPGVGSIDGATPVAEAPGSTSTSSTDSAQPPAAPPPPAAANTQQPLQAVPPTHSAAPVSGRYHTLRDSARSTSPTGAEQFRTMSPSRDEGPRMPLLSGSAAERGGSGGGSGEGAGTLKVMHHLLDQQHPKSSGHAKSVAREFETSIRRQEEWRSALSVSCSHQNLPPPPPPLPPQPEDTYLLSRSTSASPQPNPFPRHDDAAVNIEVKTQIELKLADSRDVADERRRLETALDKVNQQLSYIQMHFQTLSEKENALGESKHALLSQLESEGSEKADSVKQKLLKMMEDLRQSKHNSYERERLLVEEGGRLRRKITELREREKALSEEIHHLQRLLTSHMPRSASRAPSLPPAYSRGTRADTSPARSHYSDARSPNIRPLF